MLPICIYTDGGCSGNQNHENIGGWGSILEYGDRQKELYGGELNTTNNRMEMTALLESLNSLKKDGQRILVFSDSSYLMDCFRQKWYANWEKNNWKTSKKTDVENKDLWISLLAEVRKHDISFYRVKGHVNLKSPNTNVEAYFKKFKEWNGPSFTLSDFQYVTEKNNRADELANIAMGKIRETQSE